MALSNTLFLLVLSLSFQCSSSSSSSLRKGSSLSVEKPEDIIISPNGMFSAGFFAIGENTYSFAIWFTEPNFHNPTTLIWMANRDQPVNGKAPSFPSYTMVHIVLVDAALNNAWSSNTLSPAPAELHLKDDGNLVLVSCKEPFLWRSFDFPTDTLLPGQPLTRYTKLVSSRSESNHSSGFYKLFFDDDNVLGLHYDGPDVSSTYWPKPWLLSWDVGRSNYNSSKIAVLNSVGLFNSSDNFTFVTSDYGTVLQRRLNWILMVMSECIVEIMCQRNGIIGRLNHMNLIEMWGYCAEGKHRLLVYEYMENGSLAENLSSNKLDWSKRYKIALGTARVIAYLHEECLEWILHCDIKPQNILLDSNYQPKGTRGYMHLSGFFNLPITSKVDVYSYGIVVLEMITGKSPTTCIQTVDGEEAYDGGWFHG
ncbi:Serine/threonine-protein kinase, active site [Sesbania bispinosa]|nr:Serine/threonine-protein kinase, active site [Sesbania bispinosa]